MPWRQIESPNAHDERALNAEFRGKARFLVDESAGIGVANALRQSGYSVRFVDELGLRGRSDEDIFAAAWREKRIIITHDADFLDNVRFPHHRNPGVVVIRPGADGRDSAGLILCLARVALFARKNANWLRGKKLDFTSHEMLTISSSNGRHRYWWKTHGMPLVWEE